MAVPAEIRAIERPKNTVVKKSRFNVSSYWKSWMH